MKLIDNYLPTWEFAKSNQILLDNKDIPSNSILNQVDFSKSKIIKILFFLRGLSTKNLNIDTALRAGFILLEENEKEVVLGLMAQPWKFKGNIIHSTPDDFLKFDHSDFIKAVWNFRYDKRPAGIYLTTETRVHCTSESARKKFSVYWSVIGFFSGVIRMEMLKIIKRNLNSDNVS